MGSMSTTSVIEAKLQHELLAAGRPTQPLRCASIESLGTSFLYDCQGFSNVTRTSAGIYVFTLASSCTDAKVFVGVETALSTVTWNVVRSGVTITLTVNVSGTPADPAATKLNLLVVSRRDR